MRRDVLLDLGLGVSPAVEVPPPFADVAGAQLLDVAREHRIEGGGGEAPRFPVRAGTAIGGVGEDALLSTQEVLIGGWTPRPGTAYVDTGGAAARRP